MKRRKAIQVTSEMRARDVRECLKMVAEYKPGKTVRGAIKLSSNENPLGTSGEVVRALSEMLSRCEIDLSRYPWSEREDVLREEISAYLHRFHRARIPKENIVIGAGSDGILDTLTRIFIESGSTAVIPIPTFSLYESLVIISGGYPIFVSRKIEDDFRISADALIRASDERTKILFLCSPNNPTGDSVAREEMMRIVEEFDGMIIIDEAYAEFASHSFVEMPLEYDNVVITRTFSKAFGLAGLRIGYAILPEWLLDTFKKVSIPFSVNSFAIEAAILALRDDGHLRMSIAHVRREREFLSRNLREIFHVHRSDANFLLVDVSPMKSAFVCDELLGRGIIVRDCSSFRGAGDSFIRISVGTHEENEKVVEALKRL